MQIWLYYSERKMPYEEVYFQRMEEDNPEYNQKVKSKKNN